MISGYRVLQRLSLFTHEFYLTRKMKTRRPYRNRSPVSRSPIVTRSFCKTHSVFGRFGRGGAQIFAPAFHREHSAAFRAEIDRQTIHIRARRFERIRRRAVRRREEQRKRENLGTSLITRPVVFSPVSRILLIREPRTDLATPSTRSYQTLTAVTGALRR